MKTNYRMDTPKGQIQHAYDNGGEDAAWKIAKKLRKSFDNLGDARINRWFRIWNGTHVPRGTVAKAAPAAKKTAKAPVVVEKKSKRVAATKTAKKPERPTEMPTFKKGQRVSYATRPLLTGYVTDPGPEQSEVKWDTGRVSFASNWSLAHSDRPHPVAEHVAAKTKKKK